MPLSVFARLPLVLPPEPNPLRLELEALAASEGITLSVPVENADVVGVRPPVNADELDDLVSVLSKPDPRVPSNWSRRFKNHQEKLKSGDVYQVAEVVRNLAARNRDAALSAAERTMYERARINLVSEIAPALKVSAEEAEAFLDQALSKGVLKPTKGGAKAEAAGDGKPRSFARPKDYKPRLKSHYEKVVREALTKNYRKTEMWLYLPKEQRPPEAYAQWASSTVLRPAALAR